MLFHLPFNSLDLKSEQTMKHALIRPALWYTFSVKSEWGQIPISPHMFRRALG